MSNAKALISSSPPKAQILPKGIIAFRNKFRVTATYSGKRTTSVADTLEEAIQIKAKLMQSLMMKTEIENKTAHTWTLKEAVERTHSIVWKGKGGEVSSMKNAKLIMEYFGADALLPDITLDVIDGFIEYCMDDLGNTGATVNRKLACLSRILRTAYDRDKLKSLPRMPRKREGEHRIRFLSVSEEEKLNLILKQGCTQDVHDAVLMLLHTGFRCGELWRLECRDIDLTQGTITAWKTKNKHPRTIPIVNILRPIIERRMDAYGGIGKLFPMGSNEWLRSPWAFIRHHMDMSDDAQFVPHMLRHTCATRLSQAGVSMPIIKEWMGHSNIATTARYAHFSPQDLKNAAKLLER